MKLRVLADTFTKINSMEPKVIMVGEVKWEFVKSPSPGVYIWAAPYLCPDGDGISLVINRFDDKMSLYCFSGITASSIEFDEMDFPYIRHKIPNLYDSGGFTEQCIKVADYFCKMLCEYSP